MADEATAAAERASEQARLRKERRAAKIKAGGSTRLSKITGMDGRVMGESELQTNPTVSDPATPAASHTPDPDEVDISQHYYAPQTAARPRFPQGAGEPAISEDQLRQMMLGMNPGAAGGQMPGMGNASGLGGPGAGEDPMMEMLSQLMGGAAGGSGPGGMPNFPGMPSGPGGMPFPGMQAQAAPPSSSTSLWRLVHAIVALGLGLYIAILTPFTGTKVEREREAIAADTDSLADEMEHHKRMFFWVFATAEALLLSTRFFLMKGGAPPTGMIGMAMGFLPEPIKGYASVVWRYGQIFTTVRADVLACMFVLGVCSWWRT